jgi:acyl-coenzyme A thioesterase PaaI-like protein
VSAPRTVPDALRGSPEELREATELALATRRLMLAAATTAVDAADMRAAGAEMDRLARTLGSISRRRALRGPLDGPAAARAAGPEAPWPIFATNPQAFPLEVHFDGDSAWATTTADALYEGPPGCVHGGFVAHLLDSIQGVLVQAQGVRAVTATLELRYLAPTPIEAPLVLGSRVVERSGRRVRVEGWIEHQDRRTVEADGLFIDIDRSQR